MSAIYRILCLSLLVAFPVSLHAQEKVPGYGRLDVSRVVQKKKKRDGTIVYSLDNELIGEVVNSLKPHAARYPTQFASKSDEKKAREDVGKLSKILVSMTKDDENARSQLLHQSAVLHSMAHNMGLKGAAPQADRCYLLLIDRHPDSLGMKFEFGRYLFFSSRPGESIEYLKQAHESDHETAAFQLGLAYAVVGRKEAALYFLRNYQQRHPDDKNALRIIKAVEEDKIETRKAAKNDDSSNR